MAYTPISVTQQHDGERLDRVLSVMLGDLSQRQTRRLWERYHVLVDGRPRAKGHRVRTGERVVLRPLQEAHPCAADLDPFLSWPGLRVVRLTERFAALYKPPGLHTEHIAGRDGPSLEMFLDLLLPPGQAKLLNRLDQLTSGLVLAGLDHDAGHSYRHMEDSGQVDKWYLVLAYGNIHSAKLLKNAIDHAKRRTVQVLDQPAGSALRYTALAPLRPGPVPGTTLALAVIKKGVRHQIRAHLSHAGHPIVGDPVYGYDASDSATSLRLHCLRMCMPGFQAACLPVWPEVKSLCDEDAFFNSPEVNNAFTLFGNLLK